jgi:hypothetical protein
MGVALPQAHCQAGGSHGKFLCLIASSSPRLTLLHRPSSKKKTQIDFKSHLVNDFGNDCLMTINGTEHQLPHPAEGCHKEREPLWFPQVPGQVRALQ